MIIIYKAEDIDTSTIQMTSREHIKDTMDQLGVGEVFFIQKGDRNVAHAYERRLYAHCNKHFIIHSKKGEPYTYIMRTIDYDDRD